MATALQSHPGNKSCGRNRSVSGPPGGCAPLYRCARCIGADELVENTELGGGGLKQSRDIPFAVGEAIGKFKAVIRLDALHAYPSAGIPLAAFSGSRRRNRYCSG